MESVEHIESNISVTEKSPMVKPKKDTKRDSQWEKDHAMVRGVFKNFELPGAPVTFSYCKYKGDSIRSYTLTDGDSFELPYMVVKHINDNCRYPVNEFSTGPDGKPSHKIGKWVQRYGFFSTDFMHDEAPRTQILTVENI